MLKGHFKQNADKKNPTSESIYPKAVAFLNDSYNLDSSINFPSTNRIGKISSDPNAQDTIILFHSMSWPIPFKLHDPEINGSDLTTEEHLLKKFVILLSPNNNCL